MLLSDSDSGIGDSSDIDSVDSVSDTSSSSSLAKVPIGIFKQEEETK